MKDHNDSSWPSVSSSRATLPGLVGDALGTSSSIIYRNPLASDGG